MLECPSQVLTCRLFPRPNHFSSSLPNDHCSFRYLHTMTSLITMSTPSISLQSSNLFSEASARKTCIQQGLNVSFRCTVLGACHIAYRDLRHPKVYYTLNRSTRLQRVLIRERQRTGRALDNKIRLKIAPVLTWMMWFNIYKVWSKSTEDRRLVGFSKSVFRLTLRIQASRVPRPDSLREKKSVATNR
jgi:hypothetical protein